MCFANLCKTAFQFYTEWKVASSNCTQIVIHGRKYWLHSYTVGTNRRIYSMKAVCGWSSKYIQSSACIQRSVLNGTSAKQSCFPTAVCTILIHEGFLACTNCHIYIFVAVWAYYNPSKSRTSTKLPKDHSKNDQALVVGIIIWPKSTKWVLKINIISSIPRSYHCTPWHRCKLPVVPPDQTDPQWRRRDTCRSTPGSTRVMCRVRCMRDMVQAKTHSLSKEIKETRHTEDNLKGSPFLG